MTDKNGIRINAGDVVRISGGFFKADNGLFLVTEDGTNPGYLAKDDRVTLHKICKNGKLSKAKGALAFFPICVTIGDFFKKIEAKAWNEEHATIEIVTGINPEYSIEYFENEAKEYREQEEWYNLRGYAPELVKQYTDVAIWKEAVAERLKKIA